MKEPLLLLVHRIPFPPNKGDKIRSFHLLRYLSKRYRIFLGTFIDDNNDWQYVEELDKYCEEVKVLSLNPVLAKVKACRAFLTNQALTIPYYSFPELQRWVDRTIDSQSINVSMAYSSSMAQYLEKHSTIRRLIDFVDVDSDKWQQYAENKSGVARFIYSRESVKLLEYEKTIVSKFDASFLVSENESDLLSSRLECDKEKVTYFNNGVDLEFFDPEKQYPNPYRLDSKHIVFTGAMDYWANVDAVQWFVKEVLPKLVKKNDNIKFIIVGSNPTKAVYALQSKWVEVTGRVEDIRDYIFNADLIVAPMQIARGIQNKVLEALALNKNVITTSAAYEGLQTTAALDGLSTDNSSEFAELCLETLEKSEPISPWREYVVSNYSWSSCLARLEPWLKN